MSGRRPAKRARIGAANEDDLPSTQNNLPSASGRCTRTLDDSALPFLSTLCARVFVRPENLKKLYRNPKHWEAVKRYIGMLPDPITPKLFTMLRNRVPTLLSHEFMLEFFVGKSITLTKDLTGLKLKTLTAITNAGSTLRSLALLNLTTFTDANFGSLFRQLPHLTFLSLSGCSKVGLVTSTAVGKNCPQLEVANFNMTAITPQTLEILSKSCPGLQVFKAAKAPWTDATLTKHLKGIAPLPHLKTLKLRQTGVSEASLVPLLDKCPGVERLDISFTATRRSNMTHQLIPHGGILQKLNFTSTNITGADLLAIIAHTPRLQILSIGGLGTEGHRASSRLTPALVLSDSVLGDLTALLQGVDPMTGRQYLENVNLASNAKLGSTSQASLANFIHRVGRYCKHLNLAGIPNARSVCLAGLLPDEESPGDVQLETLLLNNTNIDDDAAPYIAACTLLSTLEVAGTKITSAGLFPIIDACTRLTTLDLTSCRGVDLNERRRFFEVWDTEWNNN